MTESKISKPTIVEALAAVMDDVKAVGKDGRNTSQNYNFRGIDATVNAVGPVLRKHKIIVVPILQKVNYRDVSTSTGKPSRECTVEVTYRFHGPAGDCIDTTVPGEAMDFGDKPLALDTPVPTPAGWTTMERIEVGDSVFDMFGHPVTVVGVSEIKNEPCMSVNFRNGDKIVATREHEWWAYNGASTRMRVWTTEHLAERKNAGKMITLPGAGTLSLPSADLPLDPWFLGYWLGNGDKAKTQVTCGKDDEPHVREMIASAGLNVTSTSLSGGGAPHLYVSGIKKILAELGVLGNKHIPTLYLRGSVAQRIALLRGLMDSDGCGSGGKPLFVSTDAQLADEVTELVRSLGGTPSRWSQPAYGFGVTTTAHRVSWSPAVNPFAMTRKAELVKIRTKRTFHAVASITDVETVPTRCIRVDSVTQSFLCGRSMIPTHNCTPKAMSVAFRIALLQALCLPTDDPDPDSHSYEREAPAVGRGQAPQPPKDKFGGTNPDEIRNRLRTDCETQGWDLNVVGSLYELEHGTTLKAATDVTKINAFWKKLGSKPQAELVGALGAVVGAK